MKKILATLLVAAMTLTSFISVSAASFTDVSDNDSYYEAVEILTALDLIEGYEDGSFGPDKTITRAEAAAMVVRMLGLESAATKGETRYTDVPATHWASGYVNVGTSQGIIAGHGDGTFAPEDPVTYEQMVKMVIYAMGFSPMADQVGQYPANVLTIAAQYNVLDKVSAKNGVAAPRKDVAQIIYNAIDEPMMVWGGIGSNGPIYEIDEDTSILEKYLHVYKLEGVVVSNDYGNDVRNKRIRVYDSKYNEVFDMYIGDSNASDFLGQNVVVYAKGEDDTFDELEVVAISAKSNRNEMTTVSDMDLVESYIDGTFEYYVDYNATRTTKINVAEDAVFVYNGDTEVPADVEETLVIREGSISFLDNNNDGDADFVFIDEFEDLVVDSVTNTGRILGKDGFGSLNVEEDDQAIFLLDGESIDIDEIAEGDVLSIYANVSETAYRVIINRNNVVHGSVTQIDSYDEMYQIDGEWYKLCPCYQQAAPELSDEGTWYLNANGDIVYMSNQTSAAARNYALVMNIAPSTDGFDDELMIRFIDRDGRVRTQELSQSADYEINGERYELSEVPDEVYSVDLIHRVVLFRENSRDEITYLEVLESADGVQEYTYDRYEKFFNQYPVDHNAVVFNTESDEWILSSDMVEVISLDALSHDEEYTAEVFLDSQGEIAVILMSEGTTTVAGDASLFVISEVSRRLNNYDESVVAICGYYTGDYEEKEYMTDYDTEVYAVSGVSNGVFTMAKADVEDLVSGAIVNFATNGDVITAVNIVYDPTNPDMFGYNELVKAKLADKSSANSYVFGEVYEKVNGNLMVGAPGTRGASEMIRIPTTGAKFLGYDYNRDRIVEDIALNDIIPYYDEDLPGTLVLVTLNENDRTQEVIVVGNFDY